MDYSKCHGLHIVLYGTKQKQQGLQYRCASDTTENHQFSTVRPCVQKKSMASLCLTYTIATCEKALVFITCGIASRTRWTTTDFALNLFCMRFRNVGHRTMQKTQMFVAFDIKLNKNNGFHIVSVHVVEGSCSHHLF